MTRWLVFLLASWAGEASASAGFRVENASQLLRDSEGRVRIFHGVNVVQKSPPWHPSLGEFDPRNSLNEQDMANLREWGFNAVRLGVMWPGVEPAPKAYNQTYLSAMRRIVEMLYQHDIYTIVDFHQDIIAERWCGEGVPDWVLSLMANGTNSTGIHTKCDGAFPTVASVFGACVPFDHYNISSDPATGFPNRDECLSNPFASYYATPDVTSAWRSFYETPEVQEAFVGYWDVVASAFAGVPGLIGYDLLNEPFPGDIWHSPYSQPWVWEPGSADQLHLEPMYSRLHQTIRKVDTTAMLFYEPTPVPDVIPTSVPLLGGVHPVGFGAGPAGAAGAQQWSEKQVLSYHIYSCGFSGVGCDRNGDLPSEVCEDCDRLVQTSVSTRAADAKRLGGGAFITEFGACTDSKSCVGEINRVAAAADAGLQSWAYWQFKYFDDITTISGPKESLYNTNGSLQLQKLTALSRTFCPAIAGTPMSMRFEPSTGAFRVRYMTDFDTRLLPTEIYLNHEIHYPAGVHKSFLNASEMPWPWTRTNRLAVMAHLGLPVTSVVDVALAPTFNASKRLGTRKLNGAGRILWQVVDGGPGLKFMLKVAGPGWKGVKIVGDDDGDDLGQNACFLQANTSFSKESCKLDSAARHSLLFDYRLELWFQSNTADSAPFPIKPIIVDRLVVNDLGPLIDKTIVFEWLTL